jgi:hypothetical protein
MERARGGTFSARYSTSSEVAMFRDVSGVRRFCIISTIIVATCHTGMREHGEKAEKRPTGGKGVPHHFVAAGVGLFFLPQHGADGGGEVLQNAAVHVGEVRRVPGLGVHHAQRAHLGGRNKGSRDQWSVHSRSSQFTGTKGFKTISRDYSHLHPVDHQGGPGVEADVRRGDDIRRGVHLLVLGAVVDHDHVEALATDGERDRGRGVSEIEGELDG